MKTGKNSASLGAAAEMVPLSDLMPWVKNPRKNDDAVRKVADSIERFGFAAPIVARRENGEVIAGHTRLKAAKLLGLTEVPVRYLDLTEREAHLLAIADNKLGELASWDAQLSDVLSDFSFEEAEMIGFDEKDLQRLANGFIPSVQPEESSSGEVDVKHICPKCGFNPASDQRLS